MTRITTAPTLRRRRRRRTRGYALLMVIMGGVVLSVLAVTLLRGVGMDKADFGRQTNSVRALYAAESAVAVGVDELRQELEVDTNPSLAALTQPTIAGVGFDDYSVNYVNPNNNYALSDTECTYPDNSPCGGGTCSVDNVCRYTLNATLTTGTYAGLTALQVPIQVLASVDINGAKATVADIVQLNLIPIFQFGLFFDGDMTFLNPPTMEIVGAAHTNGNFAARRHGTTSQLNFHESVTAAGLIQHCQIWDPADCLTTSNGVRIMSTVTSAFRTLSYGREDWGTDAAHASWLETNIGDNARDSTRGITALNPPLRVSGTLPDVEGRPDRCGTLTTSEATQSAGVEIIRRPPAAYSNATYSDTASNAHEETYGPQPELVLADTGVNTSASHEDCGAANAGRAHCQSVPRSVPRVTTTYGADDPGVASERFYWKAHIRIIDGIWYDKDNNVIFDPETWDLSSVTATTDAAFRRAMKYARVTRYSWFWDPRESRVYDSGVKYQRGLQMRVTDIDIFALKMLLKDTTAVSEIFGGSGIPAGGIILYVSETFDPTHDDENHVGAAASNVRNFLNFHVMENHLDNATRCWDNAESPGRGVPGKSPCQVGFHPYYIWGDGAGTLESGSHYVSLTPFVDAADLRAVSRPDPTVDAGYSCYNPINLTTRDFSTTAPAPCIEAGATPTGPENAVRVVRATHMPEDSSGNKIGLTFATDNRLYIYGDVNTDTSGNQGIAGKVSFVADAITLLSQKFSDRIMQRGADASSWQPDPYHRAYDIMTAADAPQFSSSPGTAGAGPNVCNAWRDQSSSPTIRARKAADLDIYASLLMGDVPDCPGAGNDWFQGVSSGGVNNFPRFLEDFIYGGTRRTVFIRGSIVSLFRSIQGNSRYIYANNVENPANGHWVPGRTATPYPMGGGQACIYSAPTRDWGFDASLLDPANLPPGTPRLVQVDRVRWVRR
jgi:Tfp pilus assembly protein PilX